MSWSESFCWVWRLVCGRVVVTLPVHTVEHDLWGCGAKDIKRQNLIAGLAYIHERKGFLISNCLEVWGIQTSSCNILEISVTEKVVSFLETTKWCSEASFRWFMFSTQPSTHSGGRVRDGWAPNTTSNFRPWPRARSRGHWLWESCVR